MRRMQGRSGKAKKIKAVEQGMVVVHPTRLIDDGKNPPHIGFLYEN